MKKNYISMVAIMAFIALAATAQAQKRVWSVGPEIGMSFSKYGKDASSNTMKPGAIGGVSLTYSIIDYFGVTGKVLLYQKGATFNNTKQTLSYIEFPVYGRFYLNRSGNFRPNIFAGPSLAFLVGGTNKVGSGDRVRIDNIGNSFNTADLGVTLGGGFSYLLYTETRLVIDARYTQGLSDISPGGGVVNNQSIALTAGITFGF